MNTKLLILTAIMYGCGMDESSLSNDDCQISEKACEKESAYKDTAKSKQEKAADVSVKVKVEVEVEVESYDQEEDVVPFFYAERMLNWSEAVSNAPEGYHLPTIEEMEDLLNDYELDPYGSKTSPKLVWTISKSTEVASWTIDIRDGSEHSYDRMAYMEVIYLAD